MARTVTEIKRVMTDSFMQHEAIKRVYQLDTNRSFDDQFSVVSLESILFYVVAFAIWTVERLFDVHKSEVVTIINTMKPHSAKWYAEKSKAFQYGFNLLPDSDQFDNTGRTDEDIANSKIVKYAAVIEQKELLQIKVAKQVSGDLAALSSAELQAFSEYINRVRDAGIYIETLTDAAEQLKLAITVHYNPLVLNAQGRRIDGSDDTPIASAIRNYINNIEFDGTFIIAHLVDALQAVDGVVIPTVTTCQYRYGAINWVSIDVLRRPISGYMRISDADLSITYVPRSIIA